MNKRRLGNFMLLNKGLNIKMGNKPPQEKIDSYFNVKENTPNTLMIRELPGFFHEAVKTEKTRNWRKQTPRYWINIYTRFFDMREEKMVNFALKRWRISGLDDNISQVSLNSLGSHNKIYTTIRMSLNGAS